jgi:acyl carrier protein
MGIKEFIEKFAAQFDDTDASVFTAETKFREIAEWSSLSALSIIAMVDEEYDVEINGQDIRNCETITDLFNLVNGRK